MSDDKKSKDKKNPHEGHRDRMRERFLKTGLEKFEDHEILELLLFYSIPRKNTNEIAHRLIEKFGTISKVFDADIELLMETDGISKNTAVLIKMIPQLIRIYSMDFDKVALNLWDYDTLKEMMLKLYIGISTEVVKIIYLDYNYNYLGYDDISDLGSPGTVSINVKKIIQRAGVHNSSHIIITHNHPQDSCTPSKDDIRSTQRLWNMFHGLGICIVDHVIFSNLNNEIFSMRRHGYMNDYD